MKYKCNSCNREWDYAIENCIFCGGKVLRDDKDIYVIEEITQVFIPSTDHPVTPYYVLLIKDSDGSYRLHKTNDSYNINDKICVSRSSIEGYIVGVIGTGITGLGIVELALRKGNKVILKSRSSRSIKKSIQTISKNLSKSMNPEELNFIMNNLVTTTNYDDLKPANIVIESVVENLKIKKEIFNTLDSICNQDVILASNTSSLRISDLARSLNNPERVIGLHFFNPIHKMQLIEIAKSERTSDNVINRCKEFAIKLNKIPVEVKDESGFIVNRLLFLMINEACCMIDRNTSTIEDIDKAMKLGANHPMGPFELADLIGLDLCLEIIENLNSLHNDNFEISKILRNLVEKKCYGRKSGKGFYNYIL